MARVSEYIKKIPYSERKMLIRFSIFFNLEVKREDVR